MKEKEKERENYDEKKSEKEMKNKKKLIILLFEFLSCFSEVRNRAEQQQVVIAIGLATKCFKSFLQLINFLFSNLKFSDNLNSFAIVTIQ